MAFKASQAWWHTPSVPGLGRQADRCKFLGYLVKLCLKTNKTKNFSRLRGLGQVM